MKTNYPYVVERARDAIQTLTAPQPLGEWLRNLGGVLLGIALIPAVLAEWAYYQCLPDGLTTSDVETLREIRDTLLWWILAAMLGPILVVALLFDAVLRAVLGLRTQSLRAEPLPEAIPAGDLVRDGGVPVALAVAVPAVRPADELRDVFAELADGPLSGLAGRVLTDRALHLIRAGLPAPNVADEMPLLAWQEQEATGQIAQLDATEEAPEVLEFRPEPTMAEALGVERMPQAEEEAYVAVAALPVVYEPPDPVEDLLAVADPDAPYPTVPAALEEPAPRRTRKPRAKAQPAAARVTAPAEGRDAKVAEAMRLIAGGMSRRAAAVAVGLPESTLRRLLKAAG